jgi:hypothetical protein
VNVIFVLIPKMIILAPIRMTMIYLLKYFFFGVLYYRMNLSSCCLTYCLIAMINICVGQGPCVPLAEYQLLQRQLDIMTSIHIMTMALGVGKFGKYFIWLIHSRMRIEGNGV